MSENGSEDGVKTCSPGECKVVMQAIIPRFLFMTHVVFSTVFAVRMSDNPLWWILCGVVVPLQMSELIFILKKRRGDEWHHFCVSIFLFACGVVPCVWVIERQRWQTVRSVQNGTTTQENQLNVTGTSAADDALTIERTTIAIEQSFIFLLIIGRWALPKGQMSRKQLSEIVLKYLGIGADVVELFDIFRFIKVINDEHFGYIILGAYSWSLLLFTFVITPFPYKQRKKEGEGDNCSFCYSEVFEDVVAIVFLDGPFLIVRLVSIIRYDVDLSTNYFFAVKNGLFIMLYIYGLIVILCGRKSGNDYVDDGSEKTGIRRSSRNARSIDGRTHRPDARRGDDYDMGHYDNHSGMRPRNRY